MNLAANLAEIQNRIHTAAGRVDRDPGKVQLIAVSKGHSPETITEAAALGVACFGESKVQEARAKAGLCPQHLRWHMIGHLQTNKCREALQLFEMIQSVDSFHLAEELNRHADRLGKTARVLIEVNVAGEASKFGYSPKALLEEFLRLNELPRIEIHGLMTIAPYSPSPERSRPYFRELRDLRSRCEDLLGAPLTELSMGMTGDFEVAVEEGATMVRIGTALFGARAAAKKAEKASLEQSME